MRKEFCEGYVVPLRAPKALSPFLVCSFSKEWFCLTFHTGSRITSMLARCPTGYRPIWSSRLKGGKKEKMEKTSIKLIANVLLLFAGEVLESSFTARVSNCMSRRRMEVGVEAE